MDSNRHNGSLRRQGQHQSQELTQEFVDLDAELERARQIHFPRLQDRAYVDHTGATLYSELQVQSLMSDLTQNVYGNPHSNSTSSRCSTDAVESVRSRVLRHFNTSEEHYTVIFTGNCTASLKIVGDTFQFSSGPPSTETPNRRSPVAGRSTDRGNGKYVYLNDDHTSVIGMRELFAQRGASFCALTRPDVENELHKSLAQKQKRVKPGDKVNRQTVKWQDGPNCLFAYPAQSNFSGERYPLRWTNELSSSELSVFSGQRGRWFVLLDAASYLTSSVVDLSKYQPDFVALSFYKIFGFPTGLGALLVKNTSAPVLQKTYFGGGTIDVYLPFERFHSMRKEFHEKFEDGTMHFLGILALKHGFEAFEKLPVSRQQISDHTFEVARYLYNRLITLRHYNGQRLVHVYNTNQFVSSEAQGPIVNVNLIAADGSWIAFSKVEEMADSYQIDLRSGCFCNTGACLQHLELTQQNIKDNFKAGHVCGDRMGIINGRPVGSVRISFGPASLLKDAQRFIECISDCFLEKSPHASDAIQNGAPLRAVSSDRTELAYLSNIFIYPIKSCPGIEVKQASMSGRGLCDKMWTITTPSGECLGEEQEPRLCLIIPVIDESSQELVLTSNGKPALRVPLSLSKDVAAPVKVRRGKISPNKVNGCDCGEAAAAWLQSVLGRPGLRLLQQSVDNYGQPIRNGKSSKKQSFVKQLFCCYPSGNKLSDDEVHVTRITVTGSVNPGLSLADEKNDDLSLTRNGGTSSSNNDTEYLLVGSASIDKLLSVIQERPLQTHCPGENISREELIRQFRPNLVVQTTTPFIEMQWKTVQIGQHTFVSCGPKSGTYTKEPLSNLAKISEAKGNFGIILQRTTKDTLYRCSNTSRSSQIKGVYRSESVSQKTNHFSAAQSWSEGILSVGDAVEYSM